MIFCAKSSQVWRHRYVAIRIPGINGYAKKGIIVKTMLYRRIILSVILMVGILWACAPRLPLPPVLEPTPPPSELAPIDYQQVFMQAEELFALERLDQALTQYNIYVNNQSTGPYADKARYRMGDIHFQLGDYQLARDSFSSLVAQHPDSPLAIDAMITMLETYIREDDFEGLIRYSFEIPDRELSHEQLLRKESLLGDAYLAMDSPVDAFYFYSLVYDQSSGILKDAALRKLRDVLPFLNIINTTHLLDRLKDDALRGYLLYHLGLLTLDSGRTDDALNALSELVSTHPGHELADPAKTLIKEIFSESITSPHTIGCLLPLSGPYRTYGYRALQGIELALSEYHRDNAEKPIRIIVKNTASDPFQAVQAVKELDQANVATIIGPIITSEPAAMEAQSRGIPIILFTQKENVTQIGEFVFRNFMTPHMQTKAMATFAVNQMDLKRFVILYPDENYGNTYMDLFWDEVVDLGAKIVGVESYDPMDTDFASPVKKLIGLYYSIPDALKIEFEFRPVADLETDPLARTDNGLFDYIPDEIRLVPDLYFWGVPQAIGPLSDGASKGRNREDELKPIVDFDALFIPDAAKKAGLIVPQLAYYDIEDVVLIGTNLWHSKHLISMSRDYIQNAILTDGFFAESKRSEIKLFSNNFKAIYDEPPGFIQAVAYDSTRILLTALLNPRIRFKSHLKDELLSLVDFDGVTGSTSFDYKGDAIKTPFILQVRGGKFQAIQTP